MKMRMLPCGSNKVTRVTMAWTKWKIIHTHEMNSLWDVFHSLLVAKLILHCPPKNIDMIRLCIKYIFAK